MKNIFIFSMSIFALIVSETSFAEQKDEIISQCLESTNMSDKLCDFLGEKSTDHTEQERSIVIALLANDQATADTLRSKLPVNSVMKSAMFFVNVPKNYAKKI